MVIPAHSDKVLTNTAPKSQQFDGKTAHRETREPAAPRADHTDHGDIERARQRLSQERTADPRSAAPDLQQARALIAQLRAQIAAAPRTVVQAHGRLNEDMLQAAMARPAN